VNFNLDTDNFLDLFSEIERINDMVMETVAIPASMMETNTSTLPATIQSCRVFEKVIT